ncbi:MAG: hypothetical protein ABI771_06115 [Betaproteobacteria bacterium]
MSKSGKLSPTAIRFGGSAPDPDLQRAVQKARAQFAGRSDAEMAALWAQFEVLLHTWRAQGKGFAPVLHQDSRMRVKLQKHGGRGDARPDYVETFVQLANQRFMLLPRFIRSLNRNVRRGLIKALALLVLREAADGNPAGALRASVLLEKEFAEFSIVTEGGFGEIGSSLVKSDPAMQGAKKRNEKRATEMPARERVRTA